MKKEFFIYIYLGSTKMEMHIDDSRADIKRIYRVYNIN